MGGYSLSLKEYSKKPLEFSNTEAGFVTFKAWMEDIAEKHGKDVVIHGMEPTGHYWFNLGAYLQDNGIFVQKIRKNYQYTNDISAVVQKMNQI